MHSSLSDTIFNCRQASSAVGGNKNGSLAAYLVQMRILPRTSTKIAHSAHNDVAYPLFITMVDVSYLPAVYNFKYALKRYGLDRNLIVVCLDDPCVQRGRMQDLFVLATFVNASVAKVKVSITSRTPARCEQEDAVSGSSSTSMWISHLPASTSFFSTVMSTSLSITIRSHSWTTSRHRHGMCSFKLIGTTRTAWSTSAGSGRDHRRKPSSTSCSRDGNGWLAAVGIRQ